MPNQKSTVVVLANKPNGVILEYSRKQFDLLYLQES